MAAVHSNPTFPLVDSQEVQDILLSTHDTLAKKNMLRDISAEVLYETCSIAGIDTSTLPLQRRSIYPTTEAMIEVLVEHLGVCFRVSLRYLT
jgi:hypothetical protein